MESRRSARWSSNPQDRRGFLVQRAGANSCSSPADSRDHRYTGSQPCQIAAGRSSRSLRISTLPYQGAERFDFAPCACGMVGITAL